MTRHDEPNGSASRVFAAVLRVGRVVRCTRTGNVGMTLLWEVAGAPGRGQPLGMVLWFTPERVARRRRAIHRLGGCRRDVATARRLLGNVRRCLVLWRETHCGYVEVDHRVIERRYL
jgi:hypothetical protein